MSIATAPPVRSRKGIKLSSIHAGRRTYPKERPPDLQISQFSSEESIAALLTPSSPDTLPEHTSPSSPKFHRSRSSLRLSWNDLHTLHSPGSCIVLYFFLNFSLTLYNKLVMNRFPFPYSMTAFHALGGCLGTWFTLRPEDRPPVLSAGQTIVLISFSSLYTLNIVVSNVSAHLVTVPFHQVVRSSAPFFTLTLSALLLNSRITRRKLISLIPVVAGVALATYGDYYYTLPGFLLTLFGTFLASLKTVITNILQSPHSQHLNIRRESHVHQSVNSHMEHPKRWKSHDYSRTSVSYGDPNTQSVTSPRTPLFLFSSIPKLHLTSLQLLHLLSPLALFQCTLLALYFGELDKIIAQIQTHLPLNPKFLGGFLKISTSTSIVSGVGIGHGNSNFSLPALNRTSTLNGSGPDGVSIGAGMPSAGGGDGSSMLLGLAGLAGNALLAFILNVVSFQTNRKVGALGMSIAANVKQVLTILSSVVLFNLTITRMNATGILLTLVGGAWYASVDLRERGRL
ncbi:hypothetical protein P691DRAFT_801116 [Macrolepiota fuliginosa MF-IS2]|uniref:Sugar phosphate transporter domain-containing protein n=1 Tax=Macrolepiota fuliginosa MF-IS2 TaxID=1400762 RepID=A0A9P5XKY1_9AGAR|nr:hypothetical protein P691DRAFT_801116 [Macrolepiota fuliginosa MF-IS2]